MLYATYAKKKVALKTLVNSPNLPIQLNLALRFSVRHFALNG